VKIDGWLLEILACPKCKSPLRADGPASELVCTGSGCGLAYPVRDDIPVLLVDEARQPVTGPGSGGAGDSAARETRGMA
jgi:uncharacterized protein YbaR (Trm112 family)